MLGYMAKLRAVNEVFEKVKRLTAISREKFDETPEELLCVKNGILNVRTKELLSFSPEYNFKTRMDITYDPAAKCPQIKKFLNETLFPEDIPVIQEWFGFHLYKRYFIKKALIAVGPKDTGKTVFLNLLTKFIGEHNKTGISLHLISKNDKFTLSFLKDKLGNIYDDLSFKDINDAGGFKVACGGGYISAEYKFGDSFEFMNYAKNTFATNKIPVLDTAESDDAYYLRWLPIIFESEVSQDKQDKFLINKITTEKELSGLLNFALIGLEKLLKTGNFSFKKSVNEIKDVMEKNSNHLVSFVKDCLVQVDNEKITAEEMFELYRKYATINNLRMHTKTQLGRGLERFCPFISSKHEDIRYWLGAGINPNNTTLTTLLQNLRGIGAQKKQKKKKNNILHANIDMFSNKVSYVSSPLHNYTDEELKKAGYTREELSKILKGGVI
jgi:P4 family phage/plasmid primase-like protien